jgi:hypothetical protein
MRQIIFESEIVLQSVFLETFMKTAGVFLPLNIAVAAMSFIRP